MDLASVVAALASVGVRVSGSTPNNNVQGDSSRACPTGLAGPEPSGTINDPGQHFQNAGQRHSPLQAPPVVLAALDATPETQIIPSFALASASPKSGVRSRFLEFTLNSSGLSIILALLQQNPDVNCSDNLHIGALGTSNSNLSDLRASVSFSVLLAHANVSSIRPETVENGESKCLVGLNRKMGLVQVD